jgi:hypothetical protein
MSDTNWVGPGDDPDRYEVTELRSRGGEGELWQGSITVEGQPLPVAIKVLRPPEGMSPEDLATRVRGQAEVLRSLEHPNLVKVREVFEGPYGHPAGAADLSTKALYLVMNWAPGENLEAWVARNPERDVLQCARIVTRLAAAVHELHSGRTTGGVPVVHRDVKPANVVVDGDQVRLVDFGLARFASGAGSTIAGTPPYLAPEVLAGAVPDEAADRFSLGATCYFIFTGQPPDLNQPAAMRAALGAVPGVADTDGFTDHVMAMVERDPARRPSNLTEWAQALAIGSVSQRFPTAVPAGGGAKAPSGRRTKLVLAGAAAVVLLLAGAAGALALSGGGGDGDGGSGDASAAAETTTTEGTPVLEIPDVVGSDLSDARSELRDAGFDVEVEYEDSAEEPGVVLAQDPPPGETEEPTVTLTVARTPEEIPDVVGQQLATAQNTLEELGITVTVRDSLDETIPDGQVIAQNPAAGSPFTDEVTIRVARQPVVSYLSEFDQVEGGASAGTAEISGESYTRSLFVTTYDVGDTDTVGFDLSRSYQVFRATAGWTDDAPAQSVGRVEVLGDGRVLFTQDIAFGEAVPIEVDVTGVLRLTLSVSLLADDDDCCNESYFAFGEAAVLGAQGDAQPPTTLAD